MGRVANYILQLTLKILQLYFGYSI